MSYGGQHKTWVLVLYLTDVANVDQSTGQVTGPTDVTT